MNLRELPVLIAETVVLIVMVLGIPFYLWLLAPQ